MQLMAFLKKMWEDDSETGRGGIWSNTGKVYMIFAHAKKTRDLNMF